MDRLKTQNLHFKRILDRQLSEIEMKHRQTEAKRLREVRSLGIDLTKLQKSTRDLDEIFSSSSQDTPKTKPRRASFSEFSHSPRPLTSPALNSGRRNSVAVTSILSRSRQELVGLSPTSSSPNSPSQNVFEFKLNPTNKRPGLPDVIYVSNYNSNSSNKNDNNNKSNTTNSNKNLNGSSNNNNNNVHRHNISDNNGNRIRSASLTRSISEDTNSGHNNINHTVITKLSLNGSTNNIKNSTNNNNNNNNNTAVQIRHRKISVDNSSFNFNPAPTQAPTNKNNNTSAPAMTREGERRKSASSTRPLSSSPLISSSSSVPKPQAQTQPRRGSKSGTASSNNGNTGSYTIAPQPIKNGNEQKSPVRTIAERRGSSDDSSSTSSSPRSKKTLNRMKTSTNESRHNETVICVHRDDEEPLAASPEPSSGGSMFARKTRRASEPAIGGHLLRVLQDSVAEEPDGHIKRNGHSPLRKSIAEGLPSGIVAEEDEDRYNEEVEEEKKNEIENSHTNGHANTKGKKALDRPANSSSGARKNAAVDKESQDSSVSSTSSTAPTTTTKSSRSKEGKTTAAANDKNIQGETVNKKPQTRRKSDGDISLRFGRIWRLRAGSKASMKELFEEKKEEAPAPAPDTKDSVWEAVRKCRYIRGYDPPDMGEPSDLSEFVFGGESKESSLVAK